MTSLAVYLEDFGHLAQGPMAEPATHDMQEAERLDAFEKGYRAGWDDAIKAKTDEGAQLIDGVAQSLQDLSFTYHEVHAQVLSNLTPLFDEILDGLLPDLARATLGAHIAEQLASLARETGMVQVELHVAPGAGDDVSQLVNASGHSVPISVIESGTVPQGRADMRLGGKELTLDLRQVTARITDAVRAALTDQTELQAHG